MQKKKSLGQHFLHSPQIVSDIVNASGVQSTDTALEIGPGEGVLTSALLQTGAQVVSVEKDDRLIPILKEKFAKEIASKQFTLIHEDILKLDIASVVTKPFHVVANIPYYITGQIIRLFLESEDQPASMTLLVQKEVADRIMAREKGKYSKESLLSLSVKAFGTPVYVRTVGKGAFNPPPTVDSAVIHISGISKDRLGGVSEKLFFEILHAGFAHKRKQLLPNLSSTYKREAVLLAFEKAGIDPTARAEDVSLETWVKLCKNILQNIVQ